MRVLSATDIFQKTNSINDGANEEKLNNNAVDYFKSKYAILLQTSNDNKNLLFQPIKRFEIFTLDALSKKIFLTEASSLPSGENRDLYYNFEIANQIYQRLIDIKESTFNDYEEVKDIYGRDILKVENEISELKEKDNEEFEKDMLSYDLISHTSLYDNYQLLNKDKDYLIQEKKRLNAVVSEYNVQVQDLSQKLKVALERIEVLQRPRTFLEKIRDLFKNDIKQLQISEKKGDK